MLDVITDHIDVWTSAQKKKSAVGRGSNSKLELYGIKKLRELILDLAVMGKLVPQDPNDEPASELLKKIAQEKERLLKEKKIKKPKNLPEISDEEKLHMLPYGWEYVRLNDIGEWGAGATPTRGNHEYYEGDIPWFKSGELTGDYIETSEEYITELALKKTSLRYNKPGDVLLAMYGATIGKTSILKVAATTNQAVCACTPFAGIYNVFLLILLKAYKNTFIGMGAGGAQPNISREKIIITVIALPPLEEQKKIVEKVYSLMALCDQLEQEEIDNKVAHQTLVKTLLTTLTSVETAETFTKNWQRISEYFDVLFTTEESIEELKQAILQLAVIGKLVPQDPNDEQASELLKRIEEEKERLVKEGEIKKQNKLPGLDENEKIFPLPTEWEWCRLQWLVYLLGDGLHGTPEYTPNEKYHFINGNNLIDGRIDFKSATQTVAQDQYDKYKKKLGRNTVLVSINGTLGNVAFYNNEDVVLGKSACYFNLDENIDKQYMKLLIKSPIFTEYAFKNATGSTIKNLGLKAMNNFYIALPPTAEQHRIVAKVDELIAICDFLKENICEAQDTQVLLADTIINRGIA